MCYLINSTGTNAQINAFICPSDPNAGRPDHNQTTNTNNHYACVGTTMNFPLIANNTLNIPTINWPSTGLFTYQQSYRIASATDGTSNTIAFAEACVGNQNEMQYQKLIGLNTVGALTTSLLSNAELNPALALAGVQACNQAWQSGSGKLDKQRGENWAHGCMAMTLFNTILTPNQYNREWTHCSSIGSTALAALSNCDSYHPGGANVLMADGHVKFIMNSVNVKTWWSLGTRAMGEVVSSDSY